MNLQPIIHFYEPTGAAYTNYGSVFFAYKLILPDLFSLSQNKIAEAQRIMHDFIKNLPNGTIVNRFDAFIERPVNTGLLPSKTFFQKHYQQHFKNRQELVQESYIIITKPKINALTKTINNPLKDFGLKDVVEEQMQVNETFTTEVQNAISYIKKSRIFDVEQLGLEAIKQLNFNYFNLFQTNYSNTLSFDDVHKIGNKYSSVTVGDTMVAAFTIRNEKQLPNQLPLYVPDYSVAMGKEPMYAALGDQFGLLCRIPHYLSTTIIKDDINTWINKVKSKASIFERIKELGGNIKNTFDNLTQLHAELAGDYNNLAIVRSTTNLIFWDKSLEALKTKMHELSGMFRNEQILPTYPTAKHLKQLWVTSNPFFAAANTETNFYPNFLDVPVCFFPTMSNYSNETQGLWFCDRFNVPKRLDLWDEKKMYTNARNFLVCAPTGGGKSFFLLELLRQFLEQGLNIVVVELGKSFEKFANLLGEDAAYIQYEEGKSFGVDPFNDTYESLLTVAKMSSIAAFTAVHFTTEEAIDEIGKKFLRNLVGYYVETEKINLSFPNFIRFIIQKEKQITTFFSEDLRYFDYLKMKLLLSDFIDNGAYAFLYNNTAEQSLTKALENKKFVGFELHNAKKDVRLTNILLQNIGDTIEKNIWCNKQQRGIVLFEEFAESLKIGNTFERVQYIAQAVRKQEGAVGIVLQSTEQLPKNEGGNAILENTQIIYAMQNDKGYNHLTNRIQMANEHSNSLLQSLKNNFSGQRKYSEIFIKRGNKENVYRLEVSQAQMLAYATDGAEERQLQAKVKAGDTVIDAIQNMLNNKN